MVPVAEASLVRNMTDFAVARAEYPAVEVDTEAVPAAAEADKDFQGSYVVHYTYAYLECKGSNT